MQTTCSCGKVLNVSDSLIGKNVKCPGCQKVFTVSAQGAGKPAPAPAGKITFGCSCGRKLAVALNTVGKKVKCPGCQKELVVPAPAKAPAGAKAPPKSNAGDDEDEDGNPYGVAPAICPACKAQYEGGTQFCVQCGTDMLTGAKKEAVTVEEKTAAQKEVQGKAKLIIIAAVVAVALATGLTFYFVLGKGKKAQPSTPAPASTPAPIPAPASQP